MSKVNVTPELADLIKMIRRENNILSKDLAVHISKSPAYITKLERGDIKSIDEQELTDILNYINQGKSTFDEVIESTFRTLSYKYTADEIDQQVWLYNYDTVKRMIPIPEKLVDELKEKIENSNFSLSEIVDRINLNEEIPSEVNIAELPINQWHYIEQVDEIFIRMKVELSTIKGILDKSIDKSNYVTVLSLVYYLNKSIYGKDINTDSEIRKNSHEYLNSHKFYSLNERNKILSQAKSKDDQIKLLSSFDYSNIEIVNDILKRFTLMSEMDVKKTNDQLKIFHKNLEWDLSFTMAVVSTDFWKLSKLSYSRKRELLEDIRSLLNKYDSLPEDSKYIETY